MVIDARSFKSYKDLNQAIKNSKYKDIEVINTLGDRFIGDALVDKNIKITNGIPGNALGAYMDGAKIEVYGNVSDATGDTMNKGEIIIHGNAGDALGYAMRGGEIYVRGNTGYRSGIHMKAYLDKKPVMIIGNKAGSFLAEYMAGGYIVVLGLDNPKEIIGDFSFKGMYGGKVYIRGKYKNKSERLLINEAKEEDLLEIMPYLKKFSKYFNLNLDDLIKDGFSVVTPNSSNPFKAHYVAN
jgi:glutamate synthase domain-containing protein 3